MREQKLKAFSTRPSVFDTRLMRILDTVADGIVVMDDTGRVLMLNHACEEMFGYAAMDVVGNDVGVLMSPDHAELHQLFVDHYIETNEKRIIGASREVSGRHRDGSEIPIELSVGEAVTPEGRQFIGVMRDLRARKIMESRLAEAQSQLMQMTRINAMDEMSAAIAHELNQPLTAITLYLQALRRKYALALDSNADADVLELLDKAMRETNRAGKIVQRVSQFIEKREPKRTPVALEPLIDDCIDLMTLGYKATNVDVRRETPNSGLIFNVDPVQIQQILVNLIRNGIETVQGQPIQAVGISVAVDAHDVKVSVSDTGPGISPDLVPNLFSAFTGAKRQGLGLGLTISRAIAQNHGGDLTVDPGGNGRGATFTLRLPRNDA